jgi:uncharacterized protein (DUF1778 family)
MGGFSVKKASKKMKTGKRPWRMGSALAIRIDTDQMDLVRTKAYERKQSVGAFVREAIKRACR